MEKWEGEEEKGEGEGKGVGRVGIDGGLALGPRFH